MSYTWDVFICHASEDKEEIVHPLVLELQKRDVKVGFDEHTLKIGDRLWESVDHGLSKSRFSVIVLSENFFGKQWSRNELEDLFALERRNKKVILPVWHKVGKSRVAEFSPMLAGRVAAHTASGVKQVASALIDVIGRTVDHSAPREVVAPDEPIPVILAGCGWWARHRTVFPLLAANPHLFRIVSVCELKGEQKEFEKLVLPELPRKGTEPPPFIPHLNLAIREAGCSASTRGRLAVLVNTPNSCQEHLAEDALEKGCHVYAERPINRTSDSLSRLIEFAQQQNRLLFTGVQRRLEAPYLYLFDQVERQHPKTFDSLSSIRCVLASGRRVERLAQKSNLLRRWGHNQ